MGVVLCFNFLKNIFINELIFTFDCVILILRETYKENYRNE